MKPVSTGTPPTMTVLLWPPTRPLRLVDGDTMPRRQQPGRREPGDPAADHGDIERAGRIALAFKHCYLRDSGNSPVDYLPCTPSTATRITRGDAPVGAWRMLGRIDPPPRRAA